MSDKIRLDAIRSKAPTKEYREGWDRTFGKAKQCDELCPLCGHPIENEWDICRNCEACVLKNG